MIDDSLFTKVKEKYPNFPEDKKDILVVDNDGNFFISKKQNGHFFNMQDIFLA
jgi:hypothetical protein